MKKFAITELSAVDRPAQEGARVLILKRDDTETSLEGELGRAHLAEAMAPLGER